MTLREIQSCLEAQVCCCEDSLDRKVCSGCGADLMSDVLAFVKDDTLLLSGMNNTHVVRTAEMLDVPCIVMVRGKVPHEDVLEMAREAGVVIMYTQLSMFTACGILYEKGLRGCAPAESGGSHG
ncbi:hypothetical protein KP626_01370 [Christensenella sp. MSJ-20]|uniref:DRTGG domain-containing protein n=1 Tax=Christensenella sp. MSJ-20 TaxID=2841518 RepID=UPI000D7A34C0|nr:MAG: hypothetical protein DBY42_06585 [Bacillota bacterium]QWT55572.1 hypothetical protein KP626_01370 [Christensenella sp. MSJ-20]